MKKLLAVMLITVFAVAAFAGITATGPSLTTAIEGSATFGLIFDETGLDLYLNNGIQYQAYWGFSVSIDAVASDNATLTLALGGSMQEGSDYVGASLYSATYEDNLLKAYYNNGAYGDTLNKYFLGNQLDGDGNPTEALGTRYLTVNLKDLNADLLYITLDNKESKHSTETGEMLWADVFGAKKSLDVSVGTLNLSAAMWAAEAGSRNIDVDAGATSTPTTAGTTIGYAAGFEFAGANDLDGLTVNGAYGMMAKNSGMGFDASYSKDINLTSAPTMTVTPHVSMKYRKDVANLPLAHQDYTSDASCANGGVDFKAEMNKTTLEVYDTVTYAMADSSLSYKYGVKLTDTTVDLANVYVNVEKTDGSEAATPFTFTAKLNGSTTMDNLSFDYFVQVMDLGNANVAFDALSDLTKKYMAYEANLTYTMDKVEMTASVYNYAKDSDGNYSVISEVSKPVYELGVNYKPNSILTLGGHLGNESNWGDFAAIHWYLSAFASYSF
ncbi:hypothetical protein OSSY52_22500 [Tepiditoga spiralis]|uniref:Alginate export domain-containing protein n=1 Tax=Tepiditoga spiralis TaxID=2108365 RepID=A0A7G1GCB9_9BACT|nr:hypothetical protein [Tepiditoga spiralis]BBE32109.1 hypothetical protein OSSY52_22500 [Tepiditoga spiralis]